MVQIEDEPHEGRDVLSDRQTRIGRIVEEVRIARLHRVLRALVPYAADPKIAGRRKTPDDLERSRLRHEMQIGRQRPALVPRAHELLAFVRFEWVLCVRVERVHNIDSGMKRVIRRVRLAIRVVPLAKLDFAEDLRENRSSAVAREHAQLLARVETVAPLSSADVRPIERAVGDCSGLPDGCYLSVMRCASLGLTIAEMLGTLTLAHAQDASTVHFVASSPRAQIQVLAAGRWRPVCDAPCDMPLDPTLDYRVGGHGLRPTPRFRLEPGPLTLDAHMASTAALITGLALTALGGPLALSGGVDLLVGNYVVPNNCHGGPCSQADRDGWRATWNTLGGVMIGVGVALLIPGVILLSGPRSMVDMHVGNTALRWSPSGLSF